MGLAIMVFFITSVPVPIRLESTGLELTLSLHKWLPERDFPTLPKTRTLTFPGPV